MANVRAAFLDPYHPLIRSMIQAALPAEWEGSFASSLHPSDQIKAVAEAKLLFVMAAPVTPEMLRHATGLHFIQKLGSGVNNISLEVCAERGIAVARLANGNSLPVAEHALLLMLAALRRLPLMDRRTRSGEWLKEEARGITRQLSGKQVGLVGLGAIGRALVKLLSGFACTITYYDIVAAPALERQMGLRFTPLEQLLATSDIVSLHLPLSPETAGLISAERIRMMKPGAVLINCARGGLVDEVALAAALQEGRLFAAGIDAFSQEPPIGNPLLALEQTVVTPHIGGATLDNFEHVIARAIENARRFLAGADLPSDDVVLLPQRAVAGKS